jgi:hypothetical protein
LSFSACFTQQPGLSPKSSLEGRKDLTKIRLYGYP